MRNLLGRERDDRFANPDSQFAALLTGNSPSLLTSSVPMSSSLTNALILNKSVTFQYLHRTSERFSAGRSPSQSAMQLKRNRSASEISSIQPKINALELYYSHFSGLQVIFEKNNFFGCIVTAN